MYERVRKKTRDRAKNKFCLKEKTKSNYLLFLRYYIATDIIQKCVCVFSSVRLSIQCQVLSMAIHLLKISELRIYLFIYSHIEMLFGCCFKYFGSRSQLIIFSSVFQPKNFVWILLSNDGMHNFKWHWKCCNLKVR